MFAKIFDSMFDGTLGTRGPWEAVVTFQQMLILCDPTGIVDMTPDAISRRTTIPVDIIRKGIDTLEKPDPESRRPDHDGRRIVRLADNRTWGWQIVNYLHYRGLRTNQDRREYFREKKREQRAKGEKPKRQVNGDAWFLRFWDSYPRKKSKGAAEKAWLKIKPDGELSQRILAAVEQAKASQDWQREGGRFIPHPASWLNAKGWEDESAPQASRPFPI